MSHSGHVAHSVASIPHLVTPYQQPCVVHLSDAACMKVSWTLKCFLHAEKVDVCSNACWQCSFNADIHAKNCCKKKVLTDFLTAFFILKKNKKLNWCMFSAQLIFVAVSETLGNIYCRNPSRRVYFHLGQDNCYWTILMCAVMACWIWHCCFYHQPQFIAHLFLFFSLLAQCIPFVLLELIRIKQMMALGEKVLLLLLLFFSKFFCDNWELSA